MWNYFETNFKGIKLWNLLAGPRCSSNIHRDHVLNDLKSVGEDTNYHQKGLLSNTD